MWSMFRRNKVMKPSDRARLEQLELKLDELEFAHNRLKTQHYKLSGSFYGPLRGDPGTRVETPPDKMDKAQLRLHLGLRPGRPVPKIGD